MRTKVGTLELAWEKHDAAIGTPIVFLHGFPFSRRMWDPQVSALKNSRPIYLYDHRGHGESDAGDGRYAFEFFVDDFAALVEAWKLESFILCGLSMGGYLALRYMERSPQKVKALVLCDTRSEADTNEARLKRAAGVKTIQEKGVPAFADGFLKSIFAPETFTKNPAAVDFIRQIILKTPPEAVAGTLLALAGRTDTTASLAAIRVPTLILVGAQDMITPPEAAQTLQQRIAGAQLHAIPDAGHLSNLENAPEFNRRLASFLKEIS